MRIKLGLIGGSGLGQALGERTSGTRHEIDTPFGRPSDAVIETEWSGVPVLFLSRHGPGHLLNPSRVPYRANIFALKQLGCTHLIASGAVGSLREELGPRDLVIPDQLIDRTSRRESSFYENAAVHVEFSEPFCPMLRRMMVEVGSDEGASDEQPATKNAFKVHDGGCYVCMEGPAFSTRAESLMHRLWGGDVIGMTAMPEAKLAREAEISYALLGLVTDYDCWRSDEAKKRRSDEGSGALLQEIIANLQAATENGIELLRRVAEKIPQREEELLAAPARNALKLAIWSDKSRIDAEEVRRLQPLWGRYLAE